MKRIDVTLPLYQEGEILEESVSKIVSVINASVYKEDYLITLVNNGSKDNTLQVCRLLAKKYPEIRVIDLGIKGKGRAIRHAWKTSDADILVFMDADLSTDLCHFPELITPLIEKQAELVIGNRLGKTSRIISNKRTRKVASRLYNFLIQNLLHTDIQDHQCGFKAIEKTLFTKIEHHLDADDFFFDTELISLIKRHHHVIKSIDVTWTESKKTSVSLFKDSLRMARSAILLRKKLNLL